MSKEYQRIGLDIGRGFVKAYSEVDGIVKQTIFKSIVGDGRNIDLSEQKEPKYIEFEGQEYFIGLLAEKESDTPIRNVLDSKTSTTVRILMACALNEVVTKDKVKIMLGVPNKIFRKTTLNDVIDTYKGKTIKVKDKVNGGTKEIEIADISILREGDAALYHALGGEVNKDKPVGMVNVGFKTTEISYFEKGFIFNDKRSRTLDFGNSTLLSTVEKKLQEQNISKDINEIDSSNDYDDLKSIANNIGSENLEQRINDIWLNTSEMDIYISGGTSKNLKFNETYKLVDDAQMATAKGLFEVAQRRL